MRAPGGAGGRARGRAPARRARGAGLTARAFPGSLPLAVRGAREAAGRALADGHALVEVEIPASAIDSVPGDGEGANEMTASGYQALEFARGLWRGPEAERLRVFFPDEGEKKLAETDTEWAAEKFRLDYLTRPTVLLDIGLDVLKRPVAERCLPDDVAYLCPYPSFNVNEILTVRELSDTVAAAAGTPIVVFNGEIERLRSGYYPKIFYPKLDRLAQEWLPGFEAAYYLRNFKGSRPGAVLREYPGPWQVFCRNPADPGDLRLVHEQAAALALPEVAAILQSCP